MNEDEASVFDQNAAGDLNSFKIPRKYSKIKLR